MLGTVVCLLVVGAIVTWAVLPSRPRHPQGGTVLPFLPAGQRRSHAWAIPLWLAGPALMIAGLLVIASPEAPSDCHGSPVCGLAGLDKLADLFIGGGLLIGGVFVLIVVAIALGAVKARRGDTVSTQHTDSSRL